MREDDILWVKELRVGDLIQWGGRRQGQETGRPFMLLHTETDSRHIGKIFLYFLSIIDMYVYIRGIEFDSHLAYCKKLNKS